MTTYAFGAAGLVFEIFTPPAGQAIGDCFPASMPWVECPSDVAVGWTMTEVNGAWTFAAPVVVPPSAAAVATASFTAAIAAGVTISSTSTPALNGIYGLDDVSLNRITAEQVYIATKGTFTNGGATRSWKDMAGAPHTFPSTAAFTSFAEAVAQYEDALIAAYDAAIAGGTWTAPTQPAALP
jgi:hypothetical protein